MFICTSTYEYNASSTLVSVETECEDVILNPSSFVSFFSFFGILIFVIAVVLVLNQFAKK